MKQSAAKTSAAFRSDAPVLAFLSAVLATQAVTANRYSYWLDELISVYETGSATSSFRESMGKVAREKVHPPLYEAILYFWMEVFGHEETATRILSSLLMAGAALGVYYLVKTQWSVAPAFFSAAAVALTPSIAYYAHEARNYALLTALTVLSALITWTYLSTVQGNPEPSRARMRWLMFGLWATNTGLLFTHYYSVFWLASQFLLILLVLVMSRPRRWLQLLHVVVVAYVIPAVLFAAIWGWVFLLAIGRQGSRFATEAGPSKNAWDIFTTSVVAPNFAGGRVMALAVALLIIALTIGAAARMLVKKEKLSSKTGLILFLGLWATLPIVFVWLGYITLGAEIYHPRYFIYAVPPLAPMVILGVWSLFQLSSISVLKSFVPGALSVLILATLLIPQATRSLERDLGDSRGVAEEVVAQVRNDPDKSYLVFSTNRGAFSLVNYYFEKFDDSVRSEGSFRLHEDPTGQFDALRKNVDKISSSDFVVIVFTFDGSDKYPNLLEVMDEEFDRDRTMVNKDGRGYIVWSHVRR